MTADTLKSYSLKDLAQLAKKRGVAGWHAMRKEQLVKVLLRIQKPGRSASKAAAKSTPKRVAAARPQVSRASQTSAKAAKSRTSLNGNGKLLNKLGLGRLSKSKAAKKTVKHHAIASSSSAPKSANGKPTNGKNVLAARAALDKLQQAKATTRLGSSSANQSSARPPVKPVPQSVARPKSADASKRIEQIKGKADRAKNLASFVSPSAPQGFQRDRLIVMVRDPYWLHAYWELTRQGVDRAQAAMGQEWHTAKPVLRLVEVINGGTTNTSEMLVRNIEIHGGVNNWYVDVIDPPKSYRLDIGYLSTAGRFFMLARSNIVSTPKAGASDAIDENWSDVARDFDRIYALSGGYSESGSSGDLQELFEERLRRPMGSPLTTRFGSAGMNGFDKKPEFLFDVDAELIVYGATLPDAHVTLQGEPVRLRSDGTFTHRFSLPNCRQVIPAVACSADGIEQRTVVLAVERNTKVMEPLVRDGNE